MNNRVRMLSIMIGIVGLTSLALPAAQNDGACMDDVKRLCGNVQPGSGAIADCMKTHANDLSQACKDNMAAGKKKMEDMRKELEEACMADIKQFCANVTPGQGREFSCLRAYDDKISAACKAKMPGPRMGMGMPHGPMGSNGTPSQPPSK